MNNPIRSLLTFFQELFVEKKQDKKAVRVRVTKPIKKNEPYH